MSHGDFNAKTKVTDAMKLQLKWWFDHIKAQYRIIDHGNPDKFLKYILFVVQDFGNVAVQIQQQEIQKLICQ
jgi:hypothetical protein